MTKTFSSASFAGNEKTPLDQFTSARKLYEDGLQGLRAEHKDELQKAVFANDPEELYKVFMAMADTNIGLGDSLNSLQSAYYYNDAAVACHYALSDSVRGDKEEVYKKLDVIQTKIIEVCGGNTNEIKEPIVGKDSIDSISQRERLEELRDRVKKKIENKEDAKDIYQHTTYEMRGYLKALYESAQNEIGKPPPCDYAVIGLGSMALQQITPWSDVEFATITKEYNPENLDYFRKLSHLVNFKMINLGETIIPTSKYQINLGDLGKPGVNFDLGGKTPLNRIDYDKQYDLIGTVKHLTNYVKQEKPTDKALPYILERVCLVHEVGNSNLIDEYNNEVSRFLESGYTGDDEKYKNMKNHQVRAHKLLNEKMEEFDYNPSPQASSIKQYKGDLEKFYLRPENKPMSFDVKQEIYRLPDRLIYNIGLIHGVKQLNAWDTLDYLREKGYVSQQMCEELKFALNFAVSMRIKVYSQYGHQRDTIYFNNNTSSQEEMGEFFSADQLKQGGDIFKFYRPIIRLQQKLGEYCDAFIEHQLKDNFFAEIKLEEFSDEEVADIYIRLFQFDNAFEKLQGKFVELRDSFDVYSDNKDFCKIAFKIFSALMNSSKVTEDMIGYMDPLRELFKESYNKKKNQEYEGKIFSREEIKQARADYIEYINILSHICRIGTKIDKGYALAKEAYDLIQEDKLDVNIVVGVLGNMSDYLFLLGFSNPEEQIKYAKNALSYAKECQEIPNLEQGMVTDLYIRSLCMLSVAYKNERQDGNKPIAYAEEALSVCFDYYGDAAHTTTLAAMNILAMAYKNCGKYKEWEKLALKCFSTATEIYHIHHTEVISSAVQLAQAYKKNGKNDYAKHSYNYVLEKCDVVYSNKVPLDKIYCLEGIADIYYDESSIMYEQAKQYTESALDTMQILCEKDQAYRFLQNNFLLIVPKLGFFPLLASVREHNSKIDGFLKKYLNTVQKEVGYSSEALDCCFKLYKEKDNIHSANAYEKLARAYSSIKDFHQSLIYNQKVLEIRKKVYSEENENNMEIVQSMSNIAADHVDILSQSLYKKVILDKLEKVKSDDVVSKIVKSIVGSVLIYPRSDFNTDRSDDEFKQEHLTELRQYEGAITKYIDFTNSVVEKQQLQNNLKQINDVILFAESKDPMGFLDAKIKMPPMPPMGLDGLYDHIGF